MNNKPIAWINEYDGLEPFNPDNRQEWIPLYTHPAKELTDEEIVNVWHEYQGEDRRPFVNFARAILRKAQEK
jgi:hypothetical protein